MGLTEKDLIKQTMAERGLLDNMREEAEEEFGILSKEYQNELKSSHIVLKFMELEYDDDSELEKMKSLN